MSKASFFACLVLLLVLAIASDETSTEVRYSHKNKAITSLDVSTHLRLAEWDGLNIRGNVA